MKQPPFNVPVIDAETGLISSQWNMWVSSLWNIGNSVDGSGTTADRPTTGLFAGRTYFDTTLGKPVWLKSVRPTVWVDGAGVAA